MREFHSDDVGRNNICQALSMCSLNVHLGSFQVGMALSSNGKYCDWLSLLGAVGAKVLQTIFQRLETCCRTSTQRMYNRLGLAVSLAVSKAPSAFRPRNLPPPWVTRRDQELEIAVPCAESNWLRHEEARDLEIS